MQTFMDTSLNISIKTATACFEPRHIALHLISSTAQWVSDKRRFGRSQARATLFFGFQFGAHPHLLFTASQISLSIECRLNVDKWNFQYQITEQSGAESNCTRAGFGQIMLHREDCKIIFTCLCKLNVKWKSNFMNYHLMFTRILSEKEEKFFSIFISDCALMKGTNNEIPSFIQRLM